MIFQNSLKIPHSKLHFTYEDLNVGFVSYLKSSIKNTKINISIPIATIITAGARKYISQFKLNPNYDIYYTDTDSIVISKPLDDKFVEKNLGDINLEGIFKEGNFLGPRSCS